MARTAVTSAAPPRRSTRNLKREHGALSPYLPDGLQSASKKIKKIKKEPSGSPSPPFKSPRPKRAPPSSLSASPSPSPSKHLDSPAGKKAAALQSRKLASYSFARQSPFPTFSRPTPPECLLAHSILASLHGDRARPTTVVAPQDAAGCGNSPSVLDALVRTVLSQNTSNKNSTRAKRSMDDVYGGSDQWAAIVAGGQPKLQRTIQSGGLSVVKSKVIMDMLTQVWDRHGSYSLDHLFDEDDDAECMRQMLSFKGIGPKTASCVLLFCLQRQSFAVDTHVHRITGLLGWRPDGASRDDTHAHLDAKIPDEEKYPLHVLLIAHGRQCEECRAGGSNLGKCQLRKAFRKSKLKGEAVEEIKGEELDTVKEEELDTVKEGGSDTIKREE